MNGRREPTIPLTLVTATVGGFVGGMAAYGVAILFMLAVHA